MTPDPLTIPWHGHQIRIYHNDPQLAPYSPNAARIGAAMGLASTVHGLRLALGAAVGERYSIEVGDGPVVALRRRQE